jgi:hypothetical protein
MLYYMLELYLGRPDLIEDDVNPKVL